MSTTGVSTPVPAATILLLRGDHGSLEVFMVVRHHEIDFASGALVFPGGKVDAQDQDPELEPFCDGLAADPYLRPLQIAAIREAFEECGVLLARRKDGTALVDASDLVALERYRGPLVKAELSLRQFLDQEGLRLACDQLTPFAHWITPDMMPKRFDTYFFLAEAPRDQVALHDGHESVDSVWISPMDAIEGARSKRYTVIFPTLRNIEKLAHAQSPREALEQARTSKIVSVTPWTERRDDGNYLCIPREAGYDISEEKMPERAR